MKVLELIQKAPELCGVEQYARWAKLGRILYFRELDEPMGVFAAINGETFFDRVQVWNWIQHAKDKDKALHVYKLLELVDANHSDKVTPDHQLYVVSYDGRYPDIDSILTPDVAIQDFWN